MKNITIDGVEYAPVNPTPTEDWVLVRSRDAGVFVGIYESEDGNTVVLSDARRIWYWEGAATLSELATEGTSQPDGCKFPAAVPGIAVLGVCEIIRMTTKAVESIRSVPVWTEHDH